MRENFLHKPYRVHCGLFTMFVAAGFLYGGAAVFPGLTAIFLRADILVTDYIYIGGFGAALVNVGLAGLLAAAALVLAKHTPSGLTMGAFGLVIGFAFFGKNPLNMLPIIAGGFLYAKLTRQPTGDPVLRAVLATCLAPTVTQLAVVSDLPLPAGIALGIAVGVAIGLSINPLATHMAAAHKGYNLYNVGWTAGIIGMGIFVVFRLFGVDYPLADYWSAGYNLHLATLLAAVSAYFIFCGALSGGEKISPRKFLAFHKLEIDFFAQFREKSYIHMGIMGLACLLFMFATHGEYNGPVIGAILSVVGFGAFGKALASAAPIVAGAMLAAFAAQFITGIPANSPAFLVAAIFSTCLSPLSKNFGAPWGIAAGFLHLSFAASVAPFHGGLNLYNNGFAAGLAAMILIPIIFFLKERRQV